MNMSQASLIYRFKRENLNRIRKSSGVLQLAILEKEGTLSRNVTVLLCGTSLFYTSDEINGLVNETGKLIIVFNPDKQHGAGVMKTWHLDDDIQVQTISSSISTLERVRKLFVALFCLNSAASLYGYRVSEFDAIKTKLEMILNGVVVKSTYTKDIVSPFDLFFLYHSRSEKKIWKNIAPASLEQEYLRLLNRNDFPLTEIHFYSDYQRNTILNTGYLRNVSVINRIVVRPEPYFSDLFKAFDVKEVPGIKEKQYLLIIGVWAHGGQKRLRKNFEFFKFLFQIAHNHSLKTKFQIVYKPHPNKHHSQYFLKYLKAKGVVIESVSGKIVDMIRESEVVISWGSLSTVYAVGLKKKVIYPKNKFINFWVDYEKDDFEANELVDVAEDMPSVTRAALSKLSGEQALQRIARLYTVFGLDGAECNKAL